MTKEKKGIPLWKAILIIFPVVFILLVLWLMIVYIGNTCFDSQASAEQYLLWILSSIMIFLLYPLASLALYHTKPGKRTDWKQLWQGKAFKKREWLFFICLHLTTVPVLFWIFSDLQHHIDIYNFFVRYFGKNYKGAPRFPIMLVFLFGTIFLLGFIYAIVVKVRYGTWKEPRVASEEKKSAFQQKQAIYFSFAIATSLTVVFLYFLKVILVLQ